jgi:hypothetical protein
MKGTDNVFSFPVWQKIRRAFTDWRFFGALFVVAVVVALMVSLGAADKASEAIETNRVEADADIRKAQISTHSQCLTINDGRRRVRSYMGEAVRLAFESPLTPAPPFTPEQRVALDNLADTIANAGKSILPDTNCTKTAPLPSNLTETEKAALPIQRPIEGGS